MRLWALPSLLVLVMSAAAASAQTGGASEPHYCMGCNFAGSQLAGQDFGGDVLVGSNFAGAQLSGATFRGAKIVAANFQDADLSRVTFDGSECTACNFQSAKLRAAWRATFKPRRLPDAT